MARSRLRFHRVALAITLAAIALMAIPTSRQLYAQQRRISGEQTKLQELRENNSRLEQRLQRLQDPEYVEKLAREQLGMVRPGEISYVVVPPEASVDEKPPPRPKPKPWYERFWGWLKGVAGAA